jgi:ketosteroid isomerase-like protein
MRGGDGPSENTQQLPPKRKTQEEKIMPCNHAMIGPLKGILIVVLAALFVMPVVAFAQTNGKFTNQKNGAEQAVRQTLDELYAALGRNDAAALDRIYADDYTLVNEEGVITAKAPRLAAIRSGEMKYESISFVDPTIRVHGDTAVATYRVMVKARSKAMDINGPVFVTGTFVRTKAGWKLFAAQATRIAQ